MAHVMRSPWDLFFPQNASPFMRGDSTAVAGIAELRFGRGSVRVTNAGTSGQVIRAAFGTDAASAIANVSITGGVPTTGVFVGAQVDGYESPVLAVPALATHIAVAHGATVETAVVSTSQQIRKRFKPSCYAADIAMNGIAQAIPLAVGIKLGAGLVRITNRGTAGEAIRVAFGATASEAEANLSMSDGASTDGFYIGSAFDENEPTMLLPVRSDATHIALANAVAGDTPAVSVEQGILS